MNENDIKIRAALSQYARLLSDPSTIGDQDDLYQLGLTSHACVNLMLALEDSFDLEFPDSFLKKSTFQSIAMLREAVESTVAA